WIRATIAGVRAIVQIRTWSFSCVMRISAAEGEFYFKAIPPSSAECGVTAYLSEQFLGAVAPVVASNAARGWLLMKALPGVVLEHVADVTAWEQAATGYGRLQAACVARVPELQR